MIFLHKTVGSILTNCYILADETSRGAAIIDPGDDADGIIALIEQNNLTPACILLTHGHYDHRLAVPALSEKYDVTVYIHSADTGATRLQYTPAGKTEYINEGYIIRAGSLEFKVMHTPGHSPGSVIYICGSSMFTGDTLFSDDCGRCDLSGGSYKTMLESLRRIASLDGDYGVYPGHDEFTTLDAERRKNVNLREAVNTR